MVRGGDDVVRIGVLGPLRVEVGGRSVAIAGRLQRRLLAALVAEVGRTVSVDALVDVVWGTQPPPSAVKTLQSYVARLRAALAADGDLPGQRGASVIVTATPGYRLAVPAEEIDASVFAERVGQARLAVAAGAAQEAQRLLDVVFGLWRGPPYGEFADTRFGAAEALRLTELRLVGLEVWLDAGLLAGRAAEVAAEAHGLCATYPLRERFWAQLMIALYRCGRQADALAAYARVRRELAEQVGADPGPELRLLEQQVLRHDPSLGGPTGGGVPRVSSGDPDRSPHGGGTSLEAPPSEIAAASTVFRGLPAGTAAFTGREDDLDRLLAGVTGALGVGVGIYVVDGMPGVGKTALVVHAAHLLADRFPDGQLFINMNAHTAGQRPVEPCEALAALLSAVGVPAGSIPAGGDAWTLTESRAALWRDRLAGKRVLLVLDNVVGHEQARPLLPGSSGCLVLLTSRNRITALSALHGASTHQLDTLSPPAAARLFARIAGRVEAPVDEDAVAALVRWCGYLPLAVAVLAGRLRHRPAWTVADLAADVAATGDRLDGFATISTVVTGAFALSYRDLPAARQRLFRSLGVHPGTDMDVFAVAALADISVAQASEDLNALYDAHLIEEPTRGRFRLHDLVRDYTRSLKQPGAEHDDASDRLLGFYQHTAADAGRCLDPDAISDHEVTSQPEMRAAPRPPTTAAALDWFTTERANLLACASYAAEHGLHARLTGLAHAMGAFLIRVGPWDQVLKLYQEALIAAQRGADPRALARAFYWLGLAYHASSDFSAAGPVLGEALDAFRRLGDRAEQASTLIYLAWLRRDMEDFTAATEACTRALAIYRDLGDQRGQAAAMTSLGNTRWRADDYLGAAAAAAEALELNERAKNQHGQIHNRFNLSLVAVRTGEYPAAMRTLEGPTVEFHEMGDAFSESWTYHWLGVARRRTGDLVGAAQAQRRAIELMDQLGDRGGGLAATHRELALIQMATGEPHAAEQSIAVALSFAQRVGNNRGLAEVVNAAGTLLLNRGRAQQALHRHQEALELADKASSPLEQANALLGIGRCARQLGRRAASARSLRRALAVFQRLGVPEAAVAADELAALEVEG